MGHVPRPLLAIVAFLLALCIAGGFALGLMPSLKHSAADDEETAPTAGATVAASSAPVQDATPLAEPPPPPPPKPKPTEAPAAEAASDNAPIATPKPFPAAPPPAEPAPNAPPSATPAPQPKLPSDLPPV